MPSINNNLMSSSAWASLDSHYGRLATSIERLSTGLRINSASDDAAGLAIRELMRSDVATLNQGRRNANDAISMLQVADSALAIIDEKLIRMKELAEQAATGTYNSTQRLMIDSEFQAMAAEIDRIAHATDFNGVKLLNGSLTGAHNGKGLTSTGAMKIHFGTANASAEDYYYVDIDDCSCVGLGLGSLLEFPDAPPGVMWINDAKIDYAGRHVILEVADAVAGTKSAAFVRGIDFYQLPVGLENITIISNGAKARPYHKPHVMLFDKSGTQYTGPPNTTSATTNNPNRNPDWNPVIDANGNTSRQSTRAWWNNLTFEQIIAEGKAQGVFDANAFYKNSAFNLFDQWEKAGATWTQWPNTDRSFTITNVSGVNEIGSRVSGYKGTLTDEVCTLDKITGDLVFFIGGHHNPSGGCNRYNLTIEADITEEFLQKLQVWRGDGKPGERGGDMLHIDTQQKAQEALVAIDGAIVKKDKIRAHLGALQNRLENTVSNIALQSENLQAAESRISDADIAAEMTAFVRNQVLSQSAVAMLGQANSFPHMLVSLLQG